MAGAVKKCKVCGKEYECCRSAIGKGNMFRWRDVACSPECGAIYFERVLESRRADNSIENNNTNETNDITLPENTEPETENIQFDSSNEYTIEYNDEYDDEDDDEDDDDDF